METIPFIKGKIDKIIDQLAEYRVKEQNDGLEVWEEVAVGEYRIELELYTSTLSSLKVLEKLFKQKSAA